MSQLSEADAGAPSEHIYVFKNKIYKMSTRTIPVTFTMVLKKQTPVRIKLITSGCILFLPLGTVEIRTLAFCYGKFCLYRVIVAFYEALLL